MTIALGLLASDGLVLAADTQETIPGHWKNETGKIAAGWRSVERVPRVRVASYLIAGAGASEHIGGVIKAWQDRFSKQEPTSSVAAVESALQEVLEPFYARHVLPFAAYPREDRPDFDLLMGCSVKEVIGRLWRVQNGDM